MNLRVSQKSLGRIAGRHLALKKHGPRPGFDEMKDGHVSRYCTPSTTTRHLADRAMGAALGKPAAISVFGNESTERHQWLPSDTLEPPVI